MTHRLFSALLTQMLESRPQAHIFLLLWFFSSLCIHPGFCFWSWSDLRSMQAKHSPPDSLGASEFIWSTATHHHTSQRRSSSGLFRVSTSSLFCPWVLNSCPICPKFMLNETALFPNFMPQYNLIVESPLSSLGCC